MNETHVVIVPYDLYVQDCSSNVYFILVYGSFGDLLEYSFSEPTHIVSPPRGLLILRTCVFRSAFLVRNLEQSIKVVNFEVGKLTKSYCKPRMPKGRKRLRLADANLEP